MSQRDYLRIAALACSALSLSGCYMGSELGYTNTLHPQGAGGGSLAVRGGLADWPNRSVLAATDVALRMEAGTSGSRLTLSPDALLTLPSGQDGVLPFARPALWLALGRWGPARNDYFLTPSLDLGLMMSQGWPAQLERRVYQAGARLEYLGRPDAPDRSLALTLYLSYGLYDDIGSCL